MRARSNAGLLTFAARHPRMVDQRNPPISASVESFVQASSSAATSAPWVAIVRDDPSARTQTWSPRRRNPVGQPGLLAAGPRLGSNDANGQESRSRRRAPVRAAGVRARPRARIGARARQLPMPGLKRTAVPRRLPTRRGTPADRTARGCPFWAPIQFAVRAVHTGGSVRSRRRNVTRGTFHGAPRPRSTFARPVLEVQERANPDRTGCYEGRGGESRLARRPTATLGTQDTQSKSRGSSGPQTGVAPRCVKG
jgi:hypothetical protein